MPNWTDDNGYNWFGTLECKRCLRRFKEVDGEVPEHDCHGGRVKSVSRGGEHHVPVLCSAPTSSKRKRPNAVAALKRGDE